MALRYDLPIKFVLAESTIAQTTPEPLVSEAALQELAAHGQAIYEGQLRMRPEPEYSGHFVAIHIDSEDYAVARSSAQATRDLQKRRPLDGRLYVRKIGSEPEWGLAARLLVGEMMEASRK